MPTLLVARNERKRKWVCQALWRMSKEKARVWIQGAYWQSSDAIISFRNHEHGFGRTLSQIAIWKSFLLTFVDQFTKYAEAIPVPNTSAEVCARAYVKHIIARHGTGSILVTDRGTSFTSVFFRETCKILGIKQLYTSAMHPQSNGSVESLHKTPNQGLSHYVNASGTNWDTLIPYIWWRIAPSLMDPEVTVHISCCMEERWFY